jgi:hypothetical protein
LIEKVRTADCEAGGGLRWCLSFKFGNERVSPTSPDHRVLAGLNLERSQSGPAETFVLLKALAHLNGKGFQSVKPGLGKRSNAIGMLFFRQ